VGGLEVRNFEASVREAHFPCA